MTTQDHPGLDASSYLLLAKGQLTRAHEALRSKEHWPTLYMGGEPIFHADANEQSITLYMAGEAIVQASVSIREALELLEAEKEETCNKP